LKGDLNVQGSNASFNNVNISSNLALLGDLNVQGSNASFNNVNISSNLELLGDLNVQGSNASFNNVNISSNVLLKGDLNVQGSNASFNNVNISSNLEVIGESILLGNFQVNGSNTTFNTDIEINGRLDVKNSNTSFIDVGINNNLTVLGNTVLNTANILGDVDIYGNLHVLGTTSEFNHVNISSNLEVIGDSTIIGRSFLNDISFTSSNAHIYNDGNLTVSGSGSFNFLQPTSVQDVTVFGSITLSNSFGNTVINVSDALYAFSVFCDTTEYITWSNIIGNNYTEVQGTQVIDENLYVGGHIFAKGLCARNANIHNLAFTGSNPVIYNDSNLTLSGKGLFDVQQKTNIKDLIVYGTLTLSNNTGNQIVNNGIFNTIMNGNYSLSLSDTSALSCHNGMYINWSNIVGDFYDESEASHLIQQNLYVGGCIKSKCISAECFNIGTLQYESQKFAGAEYFFTSGDGAGKNMIYWSQYLNVINAGVNADLIIKSINDTSIVFTDDFEPNVLNFTGSHRLFYKNSFKKDKELPKIKPGMIVISTGKYMNLDGEAKCTIDEALPVVTLSKKENDKRVFGVIGNIHSDTSTFKIGNIHFKKNKKSKKKKDQRMTVQSSGEGLIWVTRKIKNGDLISSSELPGYGMKQKDDIVRNISIAKATCNSSNAQKKKRIKYDGKTFTCYLIGCVYLC